MNKFVITIEYHGGWDYSGTINHHTVLGKDVESVYVDFFSGLEKVMKKNEKNAALLEKELKKLSGHKQSEDYPMAVFEARSKRQEERYFKFQNTEFEVSDFVIYDKEKYVIDYNMVNIRSLETWFNEHLM